MKKFAKGLAPQPLKNDKFMSNYSERAKRERERREQLKRHRTRIGKYEIPMYALLDRS